MRATIVFDIGGTNFRVGLLDYKGNFISEPVRIPTPNYLRFPNTPILQLQRDLVDNIEAFIQLFLKKFPQFSITTIGVSIAGPVNAKGEILSAPTIWGKEGSNLSLPLKQFLSDKFPHLFIEVTNDISAAIFRYVPIVKKSRWNRVEVLTVSSGFGGKIYSRKTDEVLIDDHGFGG